MRRLPTYTPYQIRDALRTAVLQTGWSETSPDTASVAAWRLAGYQADDVARWITRNPLCRRTGGGKLMAEKRDSDGILIVQGGVYTDPGEAMKFWWAGTLRLGCTHAVSDGRHWNRRACGKSPKHDPDERGHPTKCGIHSSAAIAKRKAASDERYERYCSEARRNNQIAQAIASLEPALRKIADGHNDARGLAQDVIASLDSARAAK